jgi:pseudouridine kinase
MTEREQQVLALIRENPLISQAAIAERLGISRPAVAGHIMKLVGKGIIKGRGYVISEAPYAVVVGGANIDICGAPGGDLRMRDSNPGRVSVSPGGVARNIAENLARLGADTRLIAAVGADYHGELLRTQGESAGIDMRYVLRVDTQPTSTYVSVLDETGDMLVAINDMSIVEEIRPAYLQRHEAMLRRSNVIIADANLAEDTLGYLARTFGGQALFVDAVSAAKAHRILPVMDAVHTLKASLLEATEMSGIRAAGDRQLPRLADWFHERGVGRVFITLGPAGVFYSDGVEQGMESAGSAAQGVVSASGAGDAFVAGLAYGWLNDWPLERTVRFATSAAEVTLAHASAINPAMSAETVERRFEARYVG